MVIKVGVNQEQKEDQGHPQKKKVKHKVNEPSFFITSTKTRVNTKEFVLDCFTPLN